MDVIYKAEWNYFVSQKTGILANSISSEPEKAGQAFSYFIKFTNAFVQLCFYLFISFAASTIVTLSGFIYAIFFLSSCLNQLLSIKNMGEYDTYHV